jgi:hypothetical protein
MNPSCVFSQFSFSSPYSRFGIGELASQYNQRSAAMGGIAQGVISPNSVNFANPASLASFDSLSFLFDFSATGSFNTLRSETDKSFQSTANVDYIAVGFPILKRWHTAIALTPISSIGYNIYNIVEADDALNGEITGREFHFYTGEGSFNKVLWGNSVKLSKNIAIGLNAAFLFGSSSYMRTLSFDTATILTTKIIDDISTHGFIFEPAIQYQQPLTPNDKIVVGLTYNIGQRLKSEKRLLVATMFGGDGNNSGSYPIIVKQDTTKGSLKMPQAIHAGISYQRNERFLIGIDFHWTNWNQYELFGSKDSLANTWELNVGSEILPSNKSGATYVKRMLYRIGCRTRQNIYRFDGVNVNEYAFTCGIGFPLTRSKTTINVYFEAGTQGTTEQHLVKNNFFKIGAGLSLHELWFFKRKYQ